MDRDRATGGRACAWAVQYDKTLGGLCSAQKLAERAQPGSIRPLRVPPAGGRSRIVRWLAPVAAAAAVAGLVAGISLASRSARHQSLPAETSAGTPPYYVTLVTTVHLQRAATNTLAPTGLHALVQCFNLGRIQGGQFTPLPGIPNQAGYWTSAAW